MSQSANPTPSTRRITYSHSSPTFKLFGSRDTSPFPGIRHHNVDKELKEKEKEKEKEREKDAPRRGTRRTTFLPPKKSPPILFADCYDDLPADVQKKLLNDGLVPEELNQSWSVLVTILKFILKKKIYTKEDELTRGPQLLAQTPPAESPVSPDDYFNQTRFKEQFGKMFTEGDPHATYKITHSIGSGGFGKVSSAEDANKNYVAIKIQAYEAQKNQLLNNHEISMLEFCKHPNICEYKSSYLVNNQVWIVTELLEGGTLSQTVSRHKFVENELCYVAKHLLKAVKYLHDNQLVHRDIKSANVMLTVKGIVKLIDMGLCADLSVTPTRLELLGSPLWIPPEMILKQSHDYKADIWSFAICMLELTNGQPPNNKSSIKAMFDVATKGIVAPFPKPELWTEAYRDFIADKCLKTDPLQRSSADDLLKHGFITETKKVTKKQMKQMLKSAFQQTMDMFNL
jgi:hypothetical protein